MDGRERDFKNTLMDSHYAVGSSPREERNTGLGSQGETEHRSYELRKEQRPVILKNWIHNETGK